MPTEQEEAVVERLLATIGRYALGFQALEGVIEQGLDLLWGLDNHSQNYDRLARMTNQQKIDAWQTEFRGNPLNARGRSRPDWVDHFEQLVVRLHAERKRRNSILHSQYLYDFVKIGHPVLQTDPRGEQTNWTDERQMELLDQLTKLAFDTGHARMQILHDVGAVQRGTWRP